MWKLLRNSILVAVLVAGVLKLVLWYEIQQGAARLAAQLSPVAQVKYGNVGAALNGEVEFDDVTVAVGRGKGREPWRAASVVVETPGALWLARRLVSGDSSLPERLAVSIKGLQAPTAELGDGKWLGPISFVPFETMACGVVTRFSVGDYQRMGLNPGGQHQRVEYHYDPASRLLTFSSELATPPFSTIAVRGELQKFDPRAIASWRALHVGELSVVYTDSGYLAKRNRFCSQEAGITPAAFVDQHVAAVESFLAQHGVQPGSDVVAIYRSLVSEGGRASVLSLPAAGTSLQHLLEQSPEQLTRQLNLTARRNDAPPVLVRLTFAVPADTGAAPAEPATTPEVASTPTLASPTAPVASTAAPAPAPAAAASAPVVATTAKPTPMAASAAPIPARPAPKPAAGVAPPPKPGATQTAATAAAATTPDKAAAPPPPRAASTLAGESKPGKPPAVAGNSSVLPSTPPPPPGSTLALVWKPTVDRLEHAPEPPPRDYDVIGFDALSAYTGRIVRLLTKTGKKVEGRVIGVDKTDVALRINQPSGMAELHVPREVIREIQLPHPPGSGEQD